MAAKKRGLGKGLGALFGEDVQEQDGSGLTKDGGDADGTVPDSGAGTEGENAGGAGTAPASRAGKASSGRAAAPAAAAQPGDEKSLMVKLSLVIPNKDQPRRNFDQEALDELTASVAAYGVITPLIVKKSGSFYEIIAGERRWRAAQAAGLKEIPVVVKDYDSQRSAEVAIIENLQREDLNPIEEAQAFDQLMKDYGFSQEEVADKVSKSRSAVANTLRLLKLDERVRDMLAAGEISGGHARTLLGLEDPDRQKEAADRVVREKLSVRETERLVKRLLKQKDGQEPGGKPEGKEEERDLSPFFRDYEDRMKTLLGTKVRINRKNGGKGRIEIDYYSQAELERLMALLENTSR